MKRSKRQESSIIIYFSFYFILLLALIIFTISSVLPKVNAIEDKKETTSTVYNDLQKLTKEGISYGEFKKLTGQASLNSYQKELLSSVTVDFYNDSFKNNTTKDYVEFLDIKKNELNNPLEKEKFKQKENQIIKILPPYSESEVNGEDDLLTDFKFINYIENILATFNLEYTNEIGITSLELLDEFSISGKKSKLDTDIYSIPLTLSLEGTKYNIINFIYFLENVGNININNNQLELHSQNTDKFLYRGVKIMLENDKKLGSQRSEYNKYNIFENQLIDIQSIKFGEYIDNGESKVNDNTVHLSQRIKESQGDEKIKVTMDVNFYVKGVQNIKIIDHIKAYITYFNTTKKIVAKQMGNKELNALEKNIVTNTQAELNEMTKKLKDINKSVAKQENLNKTLEEVNIYTAILHSMNGEIGYNIFISNFIGEYKKLSKDKKLESENLTLFNYITSIEKDVNGLYQSTAESKDSYNNRLNNKKLFQKVIQFQKNIELKK